MNAILTEIISDTEDYGAQFRLSVFFKTDNGGPYEKGVTFNPSGRLATIEDVIIGLRLLASQLSEDSGGQNMKTLHNSDISGAHKNVRDIRTFGDGDMFQLLCKASSDDEGWMKSTKAMEIPGVGCVVQVTTQQGEQVAEAVVFVPGVKVVGNAEDGRKLVQV